MIKQIPYKRALAVTYGAMFIEGGLNTIFVALMVLLANHFDVPKDEISILIQVKGYGTLLTLYFSGTLSDRFGRRRIILLGALGFIVFLIGFALSPTIQIALIFAFLAGMGHGLMDSPAISIIFDAIDGNTGPAMSLVQVFFSGGATITTLAASFMIANGAPWQYMIYAYLLLMALFLVVTLAAKYPKVKGTATGDDEKRIVFNRKPLVKVEGLFLGITAFVFANVQGILMTWIPSFGVGAKGFVEEVAVRMLSMYQLGSVIGAVVFAFLLLKYHSTIFMIANPILTLAAIGVSLITDSELILSAMYFASGIGMGIYFSLLISTAGEMFSDNAGSATGAVGTVNMLGNIFAVSVTAQLLKIVSIAEIFVIAAILLAALIVLAFLFRRHYLSLEPRQMTQAQFREYLRKKEAVYGRTPF